jgi:hypothetical protein
MAETECCVTAPELDSFLRDQTSKIFLQQYRPISAVGSQIFAVMRNTPLN